MERGLELGRPSTDEMGLEVHVLRPLCHRAAEGPDLSTLLQADDGGSMIRSLIPPTPDKIIQFVQTMFSATAAFVQNILKLVVHR
jgi:hypothetical protein